MSAGKTRWIILLMAGIYILPVVTARAEDGHRLWLRYGKIKDAARKQACRELLTAVVIQGKTETEHVILKELQAALKGMLSVKVPARDSLQEGSLLVGTPATSPLVAKLKWDGELSGLGEEGYLLRSTTLDGRRVTVIASKGTLGCLHGTFHLLRLLGMGESLAGLDLKEKPRIRRRLLNHWDNLDGSIERGYAGKSLWRWEQLPGKVDPRVLDYARANASLGLNGAVLNNVNASPRILTSAYLEKAAALAKALRPYGIRVYLSANFAAPKALGDLPTADPADPEVAQWWKRKVEEIYGLIPDFGGFLVKANSEGQPGPLDYKRTHAEGANLLAGALRPHGGVVIWRAFVYNPDVDRDRIKRAYLELMPLDGKFDRNVFIQPKNGPLDFQPREPFNPLFGGIRKSPLSAELQVTQEYLGHSTHLVYLGTMWEEFLDADTYSHGPGSTVVKVVDGSLEGHGDSMIAGVANTGQARNWCGHHFAQANWYAFGRLSWDPSLGAEAIASEWARLTWGHDPAVLATVVPLMMGSRQAFVDYNTPWGLSGVYEKDVHYAPDPGMVDPRREDWSSSYFVRADDKGLGFDRTRKGSGAVDQYHGPLPDRWNDFNTCPEDDLLWFHHVPWGQRMKSGKTFWEELVARYDRGVGKAAGMLESWRSLKGKVDGRRYRAVEKKLKRQAKDAQEWRDKCLKYFQGFSKMPLPPVGK